MLLIDKYAYTNKLSKTKPMVKFSFAMGMLILALLPISVWGYLIVFAVMSFVIVFLAKIPLKNYGKMLIIPFSFLMLSVISIIISFSKDPQSFIYYAKLGNIYFGITKVGIEMSVRLIFRVAASISCMYFFSLTTSINQQIEVYKKLRIPKEIVELMVLIYRFIFIFLEEAMYMRRAQEMRFGYNNFKNSCASFSNLVKMIFVRVMRRNKDMLISLESKFFDGEFHI